MSVVGTQLCILLRPSVRNFFFAGVFGVTASAAVPNSPRCQILHLFPWILQLEVPEASEPNPEGQQYLDAKSYIFLEISVANPIVPKRKKEQLSAKVADYVPPRPLFPKRIGGAAQVRCLLSNWQTTCLQGHLFLKGSERLPSFKSV